MERGNDSDAEGFNGAGGGPAMEMADDSDDDGMLEGIPGHSGWTRRETREAHRERLEVAELEQLFH